MCTCKCSDYKDFLEKLKLSIEDGSFKKLQANSDELINVKYKRIDKNMDKPIYETDGAVGIDLYAREETILKPNAFTLIPTNVIIRIPKHHMLVLTGRSSTSYKHKQIVITGIIDQDYNGEKDEIKLQAWNPCSATSIEGKASWYTVKKGQKLGQAILVKIAKANLIEQDSMDKDSRGGFGSTD